MDSVQDTLDRRLVGSLGCQYIGPEQDPAKGRLEFCGCKDLFPGKSYCLDHVWKIYQKGTNMGNKRKVKAIEKELLEIQRLEKGDEVLDNED